MKIAYFSDNSYPELSGIVDSILTTGAELKKRGHEIVFVGPRYADKDYEMVHRAHEESGGQEMVAGMPIVRLPSVPVPFSPTGQSRNAFPIGASFKFLDTFKPDIIHTQSPYGAGWEAVRAAKRYKLPLIGTNHTPIEEFFPLPFIMRRFDAWYYNHCRFVTAPYQGLIDNMRQVGFKSEGRAQPNPVPFASSIPSAEQKLAAKAELGLDGPVLLVSGRLATEKRVDEVLRAAAQVLKRTPRLTVVITGHGAAESSLKNLAATLGIAKDVRFLGFVRSEELPRLYKASDIYAIMSTAETQSLSLMQALSAGVPAVAARARGLADYCPPDAGFLVEPGDIKALADKILYLIQNDAARIQMGAAGAIFVNTLSPQKIAADWEEIYSKYSK